MELHSEYRDFLNNELKAFNKELISILELPTVGALRNRIKKDKRDTQSMLNLYNRIENCNILIRTVKAEKRGCIDEMHRQLGIKKRIVEDIVL